MPSFSKLTLASCLLAAVTFPASVRAYLPDTWTPSAVPQLSGYIDDAPIWFDNFDGDTLDTTKWNAKDIAWPDNGEQQYYTPDAATVSGGQLHLTASMTPDADLAKRDGRKYTSARIDTTRSVQFRHGLMAARIKMTYSQGLWPAWWMFGTGPKYSEFDIAELVGGTKGVGSADDASYGTPAHFSVKDMPTDEVSSGGIGTSFHAPAGTKFADDYYTMWIEWTPTTVLVGMDGYAQKIVDDVSKIDAFDAYMYLILNVAVGGNFPGNVDSTTVMPQSMDVDWVRVWNKNGEDIMRVKSVPDTTEIVYPEPASSSSSSTGSAAATNPSEPSTNPTTPTTTASAGSDGTSTTTGTSSPSNPTTPSDAGTPAATTSTGNSAATTPALGGGGGGSTTSTAAAGSGGSTNTNSGVTNTPSAATSSAVASVAAVVALAAAALYRQ